MTAESHNHRGQTNVKVTTYDPLHNKTSTEHGTYRSETFYPATNRLIKTVEKSTRPELSDSETRVLP